jgi:hypothetical protein
VDEKYSRDSPSKGRAYEPGSKLGKTSTMSFATSSARLLLANAFQHRVEEFRTEACLHD